MGKRSDLGEECAIVLRLEPNQTGFVAISIDWQIADASLVFNHQSHVDSVNWRILLLNYVLNCFYIL